MRMYYHKYEPLYFLFIKQYYKQERLILDRLCLSHLLNKQPKSQPPRDTSTQPSQSQHANWVQSLSQRPRNTEQQPPAPSAPRMSGLRAEPAAPAEDQPPIEVKTYHFS
jgi:hypothetical protein